MCVCVCGGGGGVGGSGWVLGVEVAENKLYKTWPVSQVLFLKYSLSFSG